MQSVLLIRDPLNPRNGTERAEVEDIRDFLMERFEAWPAGARIYHGPPAVDRDITPATPGDVERLPQYDVVTVVVYPESPLVAIIIAVVIAVVAVVATLLLMPKVPSLENQQQQSPNNGLAARSNKPRPNARVPDIYGQVRSVPDLIAAPYRVYEAHRELEIAYMCVGRGEYDVADVRDGDTLISEIDLASCEVYGPYSSPNDFTTPQLTIGTAIGDPVFDVIRLNEVNGQTLKAANDTTLRTTEDLRFVDGGIIRSASGTIDFTDYFQAGDLVDIGNAIDGGGDSGSDAIQAAGLAHAGGIDFTDYDPTADFEAGKFMSLSAAVFQVDDGGTSGTISGGTTYPSYPNDPYQPRLREGERVP